MESPLDNATKTNNATVLNHRYLLFSLVPFYKADDGTIWTEELWHRDLVGHFNYLSNLTIAAPRLQQADTSKLVQVKAPPNVSLSFVELPHDHSAKQALLNFPRTFKTVLRSVRTNDIIHSGVAGWPYPVGAIANPMAKLLRKKLIINIESSFWRLDNPSENTFKERMRASITEAFARWSVKKADLRIFTNTAYSVSLAKKGSGAVLINPASWINEADILDPDQAQTTWSKKPETLRILFAARLTRGKGTLVLLEALKKLDQQKTQVQIDILGEGPERSQCEAILAEKKTITSRLLDPVPYGPAFYSLLRKYHALVVPSITDEQPRIIYDAFSQAVPVLASDTGGHRDCVKNGETGYLFPTGDSISLVDAILRLNQQRETLSALGMNALKLARNNTHQKMHKTRSTVILDLFGKAD